LVISKVLIFVYLVIQTQRYVHYLWMLAHVMVSARVGITIWQLKTVYSLCGDAVMVMPIILKAMKCVLWLVTGPQGV